MSGRFLFLYCSVTNFLLLGLISPGPMFKGEGCCSTHVAQELCDLVWSTPRISTGCPTPGPAQKTCLRKAQKMSLHMLVAVGFSYRTPLYNSRHQHHKVSIYLGERKFSTVLSLFPTAYMLWDRKSRPWFMQVLPCFQWGCLCWLACSCNMFTYIYIFLPGTEVGGPFTLVTAKCQMAKMPVLVHLELYSSCQLKGQDFVTAHRTLCQQIFLVHCP